MLSRIEKWFVNLNRIVLGVLALFMFGLVIWNVASRYLFSTSINWAEELASIIMIWVAFLGAGLAMREGQIVAIETLFEYIPKRAAQYVRALVALIILVFMGFLAYLGFSYSEATMHQQSASLRWSLGIIYLAVPIGSILFILHFIAILRKVVSGSLPGGARIDLDDNGGESRD